MILANRFFLYNFFSGLIIYFSLVLIGYFSLDDYIFKIFAPSATAVLIFYYFIIALKISIKINLISEIGFIYLFFILAYTLTPAYIFIVLGLDNAVGWSWWALRELNPTYSELGIHLWRHSLFMLSVGLGYIVFRGHEVLSGYKDHIIDISDRVVIRFLLAMLLIIWAFLLIFSAPVNEYTDNYTRFDELSSVLRFIISILARLKIGFYLILFMLLFANYKDYKILSWLSILIIIFYELINSYGARIEVFFLILMALFLYNNLVMNITVKKIVLFFIFNLLLFTALEILRSNNFDLNNTINFTYDIKIQPASEFGSVFITGFHLYIERNLGGFPTAELPMLFTDFINLVMPNNFVKWSPMHWYAAEYYPASIIPPATLGPIADSAIWGGEVDLALRGIFNGAIFALIVRWYIGKSNKWWALVIYTYCYATCIMSIKYSPLYMLNPLIKTFLISIVCLILLRFLIKSRFLM